MASVFSHQEISQYLDYLDLPPAYKDYLSVPKDYEFLRILHVYQISKVPYENLQIHYSKDHAVNIDPKFMLQKIIAGRGRGGYCMELCVFWYQILLGLGFKVYQTGIRIRLRHGPVPYGDYIGLCVSISARAFADFASSHTCNIVTFEDGTKYAVDVSFGGDGPTRPLKLVANEPITNLGTQEVQFTYEHVPQFVSGQKQWIYQYRNKPEHPWNHYYCFNEVEFLYGDFVTMNWWTSAYPTSFQNLTVLAVKFIRRDDQIVGKVMLVDREVKRNMGGKTELVKVCQTEQDRVDALKEYFDLSLTGEEAASIIGRPTDLGLPQSDSTTLAA